MLLQKQQIGALQTMPVAGSTEHLQQILTTQQQRDVSYDEGAEIGDALVEFYQAPAEEADNESAC